MTRLAQLTVAIAAALCAAAGAASETISHSYDGRGRLVKVVRTGTVNNNVSASYGYDKADNRINVVSPNPRPQ